MKATDLLRADHESIRRLLSLIDRGGATPAEMSELGSSIRRELVLHTELEERLFYPAMERLGEDAAKLADEALAEHGRMRLRCDRLATVLADAATFRRELTHLRAEVERHFGREEQELFDLAENLVGIDELEDLGIEMEELEVALLTEPAATVHPGA